MARYFKVVEIDCDSFIEAMGEDLDCDQLCGVCDDTEMDEITVSLDIFEEV